MRNTIRCCIACIFPCGALDVIRIVHTNGRVEEISGSNIKAGEIMRPYPNHVLKIPSSPSDDGSAPKIEIVPPEAELRRGKIYFLMPVPSKPEKTRSRSTSSTTKKKRSSRSMSRADAAANNNSSSSNNNTVSMENLLISNDQYLSEILSEKVSTQRDRRRGRVGVWRPHLESISEIPN